MGARAHWILQFGSKKSLFFEFDLSTINKLFWVKERAVVANHGPNDQNHRFWL